MKRGVIGFRPERLSQALDVRGLSQVQLAAIAGVSAGSISKWRSGQQEPTTDGLSKLARAVNVQPDWFLRPLIESDASARLFRSNASALKSARSLLSARHTWAKELAAQLSEFVEYPNVVFPQRDFRTPLEITDEEIEVASSECRKLWKLGLGPVPDVVLAIENAGGIVVRELTGVARIEGLSSWCSLNERPFVYLNAEKANGFRSRFDAAHELGHIVLHRNISPPVAQANHKEMERQAHYFAGAFLMPAESFSAEIPPMPSLDTLLALKPRWKVSVAAMQMRLGALKLIDEREQLNLWKRKSARFGGKSEPLDDQLVPEQPRLLRRAIGLIIESGIVPRESLPERFGLSAGDVENLAGLPEGYFEPMNSRVIDLDVVRLRRSSSSGNIG
ncbi:helix-turn-helix domain-containing protein [Thiohalomonas denitrificans]|uniref:Zn-dependent peptidase ImmA, M78 family n=1 Tax=Thiohalomonas denitrificans TaxID=415747 RepID=A0A1G5QTH4_9GAMM|nr:XRE family transcriptional regulator [Thiohalomonas denitrificans]SCZ64850.1 Zn-dependent peptidase ImmA, M78 family [Thiohalomonas denitrificans]